MPSCCDPLIEEHRRTEALMAAVAAVLASPSVNATEAKARYEALIDDLYRHFALEEATVFVLLSPYRTMMLMAEEHDQLLTLHEAVLSAFLRDPFCDFEVKKAFGAFQTRLNAHMLEEERAIFPLADARLEPEEIAKLHRLIREVSARQAMERIPLMRPVTACRVSQSTLFQPVEKAMDYRTLYQREHATVQQVSLQAGQAQVLHWVGPHQCLVLITGKSLLKTPEGERMLSPGEVAQIDSRHPFALTALEDSQWLVFQAWPHPHYTKASV